MFNAVRRKMSISAGAFPLHMRYMCGIVLIFGLIRSVRIAQVKAAGLDPNSPDSPSPRDFAFALPEETPVLMTDHMDRLNADLHQYLVSPTAVDFPELLARQHAEYIQIHPFDDGNGRTGRLITSWLCLKAGFPVSIIPVTQRDTYLAAMDQAHAGDLQPLRDLLAATLVGEVDFGLAVARGECDPSVDNEHADPTRPVEKGSTGAAIITNGWEVR